MTMGADKIQVLIVDDSASARAMLRHMIETDPQIVVQNTAGDAFIAADRMKRQLPDVILLDLEMPGMSGLTFIEKIMAQKPIPIVVCSSHAQKGSDAALSALRAGALEAILKPAITDQSQIALATRDITHAIRAAFASSKSAKASMMYREESRDEKNSPDVILPKPGPNTAAPRTEPIVCIGASTGGTVALEKLLTALPADCPPILIVQHMPPDFTAGFARRLNSVCTIEVVEATNQLRLSRGTAVIAKGGSHLLLRRMTNIYTTSVVDGPYVQRHNPSVDVLFRSAANAACQNAMGILLTGMGDDGALGLLEMRQTGANTIAQDEASSVVFGMPRVAIEKGAAGRVLPLSQMAAAIMQFDRQYRGQ